jgi:ABC-2 type transport system ATP-binding protein
MNAIMFSDVTKYYRKRRALDRFSLEVSEFAGCVFLGPNGAGKTTAIRILLDLVRPDSGKIRALDLDPRRDGPSIRSEIGYISERGQFSYSWMSVGQAIDFHASHFPKWDSRYAHELMGLLEVRTGQKLHTLSKGEMKRVALLCALAHRPRIIIMDEPFDGLDPGARIRFTDILTHHLSSSPATMVIATHHPEDVESFTSSICFMTDGQAQRVTTTGELVGAVNRIRVHGDKSMHEYDSHEYRIVREQQLEDGARVWTVVGSLDALMNRLEANDILPSPYKRPTIKEATEALFLLHSTIPTKIR